MDLVSTHPDSQCMPIHLLMQAWIPLECGGMRYSSEIPSTLIDISQPTWNRDNNINEIHPGDYDLTVVMSVGHSHYLTMTMMMMTAYTDPQMTMTMRTRCCKNPQMRQNRSGRLGQFYIIC